MHDIARVANVFGAAALAATGAMAAAAAELTDGGMSAAAALITLASEPGIGVTELSRRIGLSQPGTTRLVETLAGRGLVVSEPSGGSGRRTVALGLSTAGRETAGRILAERERVLTTLLAPLGDQALADLDAALSAMLQLVTEHGAPVHQTCRLCDERACTATAPCPVEQAGRHSY